MTKVIKSKKNGSVGQHIVVKDWHWTLTVTIIGLFFGMFSLTVAGAETVITKFELSRFAVFCCVVPLLIPMRYYGRWLGINKLHSFLFSVLGIGPIICGIALWMNFFIHQNKRTEE